MKVLCVNSKGFPNEIPVNKRPVEGNEYTVVDVIKCNAQGGLFGYILAEIDISDCVPYICFAANRFKIPLGDDIKEEELALTN